MKNFARLQRAGGITLMFPHRKNMRRRTPETSKKHLRKRYTVEINIQRIKTYNRVLVRRDRKIANYASFVYLAMIYQFKKGAYYSAIK